MLFDGAIFQARHAIIFFFCALLPIFRFIFRYITTVTPAIIIVY